MKCNEDRRLNLPTVEHFKTRYTTAFGTDDVLEMWRTDAVDELCFKSLCPVWERAVYLYMAHQSVLAPLAFNQNDTSKPSGNVKRHKTDDVETEFFGQNVVDVMDKKGGYNSTPFGRELLSLMRRHGAMGVMNTRQASIPRLGLGCTGGFSDGF